MEEKILEAREEFNNLIDFVTKEALTWALHSVEGEVFRELLRMRRILLEVLLRSRRHGKHVADLDVERRGGSLLPTDVGAQISVDFRSGAIVRAYYLGEDGKGVFPLEAQLNLPMRMYSYLLQKCMIAWGVRTSYEGPLESVKEFLGLDVAHRPSPPGSWGGGARWNAAAKSGSAQAARSATR